MSMDRKSENSVSARLYSNRKRKGLIQFQKVYTEQNTGQPEVKPVIVCSKATSTLLTPLIVAHCHVFHSTDVKCY